MPQHLQHLFRSLSVVTVSLSLISYLPMLPGVCRVSARATAAVSPVLPALQGEAAVQQLKEQGLYDSLSEAVAASRYRLRWEGQPALSGVPPSYLASNPAQRIAAYFTPVELHLAPLAEEREVLSRGRASETSAWRGAMRLVGYGYGESLLAVGAAAELAAHENRIEYRRPLTSVTEWYVNKAEGLEQGFDIAEPPGARGEGVRLRLALEVTGDLRAELVEAGEAIALRHVSGGMALRYGELHAYDANEQALPARLRVEEGRVILEVEDAKAVYPVRIDPLLTQQQKLTASDGTAGDVFGASVAISGDTAVVGAIFDGPDYLHGSAYVFVRSGTSWSEQQKLTTGDQAHQFGFSVAISGDTAVVGTYSKAAYVFVRSGGIWSQQQKLKGSDPDPLTSDGFGASVAIKGDTVVVGAFSDPVGANSDQGAVYVFVRSGAIWSLQQKLTASDGADDDGFGYSVAISGETVAVGAHRDDIDANIDQGSAYVFVRSGTTWSQQQKLMASDGGANDWFGKSVAISGDTVVVGAYLDDIGSAYVFVRSGTFWNQQQKLTVSEGQWFGFSVGISGETVVVGTHGGGGGGSAYVFVRSGTSWSQQQKLTASDVGTDGFGYSVAINGDMVIVGASGDDIGANSNQGSAYVFATWGEQQKLSAPDGGAIDHFGTSVAISGDTVVVGSPNDDIDGNFDQGSAYVFVRRSTWYFQQKLTASGGAALDWFGFSVAISGDTVVVGAPHDDIGVDNDQGSAYVFFRSGTDWTQQQKLTVSDGESDDQFGNSVTISGDTIIIGSRYDDIGANFAQGSAYVFVRGHATWFFQQKLIASGGADYDYFGFSVAISGETAVVGAYRDDVGANSNQGSAYVFVRGGATWTQQQKLTASDGAADDGFGYSVAISGVTVVVGAPDDDVGADSDQGSAYVFFGRGGIWTQQQKITVSDGTTWDSFGYSVAISGDTAIVGSRGDDHFGTYINQGSAYVFVRDGTDWSLQHKLTGRTGATDDRFGSSVAINGNRAVVGAPYAETERGAAYLFVRK